MASERPQRSAVDTDVIRELEAVEGENFTIIEAAEDRDQECLDLLEDGAGEEGGTVIEVPVSYGDLQSSSAGEAYVIQEAEPEDQLEDEVNDNREEEEAEEYVDDLDDTDEEEVESDPDFDPNDSDFEDDSKKKKNKKALKQEPRVADVEKCSICGVVVADLAIHIVNMHSANSASPIKNRSVIVKTESVKRDSVKRPGSPIHSYEKFGLKPRKRAYTKGKYQQIKPVLRFPCDSCKHVSKTSEQLKKHIVSCPKAKKGTSWMFCGECDYATRVEEELVNHVKMHQLFSILKDDMEDKDEDDEEDEEIDEEAIIRAATGGTGLGNYDPNPMSCGDCDFETHYENELFEHLKMHLRKEANIPDDTETEVNAKKQIIDASVEQKTIYEEDDCLHCGLCSFSSKSKKNILRHSNLVHGVVINDKDYQGGATIKVKQTAYYCTLCKFRGASREELAAHRKRTIHNKYGGVTAVDPIAEAEERKARIRNNCL